MECIFCKIIKKEIPAHIVYEDDDLIAILDISQSTQGHTLILPKNHVATLYDLTPPQAATIFRQVPEIARAIQAAFHPIGMNLLVNVNQPMQSVFHLHIHLIPRYPADNVTMTFQNNMGKISQDALADIAAKIREQL
ncbi:MAG: HIT family protein [Candidatus Izemoplasmatales bacterium]|jgi:histidine triad (HIT) family protein|nr:HIT family protein [Candidatus Izemoplasmatales bacterium]MDD4354598.1 HIT family protein [Candidatus Izemoplasmatales bacterium]MDD5602210.1 HIT family protein [Candidatus Izemoplasmatales bacterium]MDY0372728.1 HIT family protein [Candidatus Izemoplasmatales bacterium]